MKEERTTASSDTTTEDYLEFHELFRRIDAEFSRLSPLVSELEEKYFECLSVSAMAKCLDFNLIANDANVSALEPFFLVSNCRSISEELIYVAHLRSMERNEANKLSTAIASVMHRKSVLAQTRFFAINNSLQPTIGGLTPADKQERELFSAEEGLKKLWAHHGFGPAGRVSVRRLSRKVGLKTTYDYVYHLTSNYVHFNPSHLFKLGWGPLQGPFTFSVKHFNKYYLYLARFLGAILFLGYISLFSERLGPDTLSKYQDEVTSKLESGVSWPEIITFEEMNREPPKNILIRALMSVLRQEDRRSFPNILEELRSLDGHG